MAIRCTGLFLFVVSLSAFLATYNTMNMVFSRHRGIGIDDFSDEGAIVQTGGSRKLTLKEDPPAAFAVARGVVKRPDELVAKNQKKRMYHTVVTANDNPYSKWQCRVMYYHYKKFRDMEGSEMGGFTRVLHSGQPDNLMDEIPTWIAQPLPPGMDKGYVVLNRPWAFVQWVEQATVEEEYIFMAEPDHIIVKPIPNMATEFMPAAFPFFYIVPRENEALLRRWIPEGPITVVDPIGNSPVMIKQADLKKIVRTWHNVSLQMKEDPKTDKVFGWVLEMYAYATASAMNGISHILRKDFMIQPPWDTHIGSAFIIHYTYGCDYNLKGEFTPGKFGAWRFDKRSYSSGAPPRNLSMPPHGAPESVIQLITKINEATAAIPDWREGAT